MPAKKGEEVMRTFFKKVWSKFTEFWLG